MPMYRVSVSGDSLESAPDPNDPTPEISYYEFEANDEEQAAAEGRDMWRKQSGVQDEPQYVEVERINSDDG